MYLRVVRALFANLSSWQEDTMMRERALKVVLVIVGLLFVALVYAIVQLREEETLQNDAQHLRRTRSFPAACGT